MSAIDVEKLVCPISPDAPSGIDLSESREFLDIDDPLQSLTRPLPAYGERTPPKWSMIWRDAETYLTKSHDLRIVVRLAQSGLATHGIPGFRDALQVLHGLLDQQWDTIHPQLGPDSGLEADDRAASLQAEFEDARTTINLLRKASIVEAHGKSVSLHDVCVARGEAPGETPKEALTLDELRTVFNSVAPESLQVSRSAVVETLSLLDAIEKTFNDKAGQPVLVVNKLKGTLQEIKSALEWFAPNLIPDTAPGPDMTPASAMQANAVGKNGEITNREDVTRALNKICGYYDTHEPSSPVPPLLKLARRLVDKHFFEIINLLPNELFKRIEELLKEETN